jgi:RES domain
VLSWEGRFDDPRKHLSPTARFRTLYFARRRVTALRETLQDLRPDTRTRADYRSLFGVDPPDPILPWQWRADRRIARARISAADEEIIDLENLEVRRRLEEAYAPLLAAHGMRHLDISQLRSEQRVVTQTIALELWAQGRAGIAYASNLDGQPCVAIFEGRTSISRYGPGGRVAADDPDLVAVAAPWLLRIEPD